jgi:HSP20 family molecular chaperone IbpA
MNDSWHVLLIPLAGEDKTVSREFSRQVDIPQNVDPQTLHSTLSGDGILQVEATVQTPANRSLTRDTSSGLPHRLYSPTPPPVTTTCSSPSNTMSGRSVTETDGTQVFRIVVDIGSEFEPSDLAVKTVDRKLVVHARHEEKAPGRTSCREFNREFDLPIAVDPLAVTAAMSSEGKLVIEAPIASFSQGTYSGRPGSIKQPTLTVSFKPNTAQGY